ncbi:hypothetical protein AVEN_32208-1 [Araneus ventricosus]|uniref:Uncharacterized protein n=1 Tax=Araneus ventricosus TaxID=182803 RepID=A0A4Y2HMP5_ARAVE|nr:hypothetical protein AVEN_32208-1 [Araneus ventricosus]
MKDWVKRKMGSWDRREWEQVQEEMKDQLKQAKKRQRPMSRVKAIKDHADGCIGRMEEEVQERKKIEEDQINFLATRIMYPGYQLNPDIWTYTSWTVLRLALITSSEALMGMDGSTVGKPVNLWQTAPRISSERFFKEFQLG